MRLTCLQENLNRGLSTVGRAVATRTTLPVTNNVLLATDRSRLKLVATNLEIAITAWVGARVEEEGAITLPARLLAEFVASLPNDRIDMALASGTQVMQLRCARHEARFSGIAADEFPPIPQVGEEPLTTIAPEALRQAIHQVEFAAASDDSRPVLTGALAEFEGSELTLATADGFRLAVHQLPLVSLVGEKQAVIIPARSLRELGRLLPEAEEPVEVVISPQRSQILFHIGNVELVSQLISGTFPNYGQLIPRAYATRAVVERTEFLRAIRLASVFARDGAGIVRLQMTMGTELTPGKMSVAARAEELGDNFGEIDAAVSGEDGKVAFNSRYLEDVLSRIDTAQVALEITSSSAPGAIKPLGVENYVHVVMPMFVQW